SPSSLYRAAQPPASTLSPYTTLFRSNPPSYGQAMQHFVHELLGQLGILVVHMDEIEFKKKMIPFFIDDLVEHTSHRVVQQIQERSEEHTSELQSRENLVCRLLLEKKK